MAKREDDAHGEKAGRQREECIEGAVGEKADEPEALMLQASEKLAEAADIISRDPATLQLRYLQTLGDIGVNQNSTVVFPLPLDLIKPMLGDLAGEGTDSGPPDSPARTTLREAGKEGQGRPGRLALDQPFAERLEELPPSDNTENRPPSSTMGTTSTRWCRKVSAS